MATLPIVTGALLVVGGLGAFAGSLGAFDSFFGDEKPCGWHVGPPLADAHANTLRLVVNNSVGTTKIRVCAFDSNGLERSDQESQAPVSSNHVVDIKVPQGAFLLVIEAGVPEGYQDPNGNRLGGMRNEFLIDATKCHGPISKGLPIHSNAQGYMWYGLPVARCEATGEAVEEEYRSPGQEAAVPMGSAPLNGPPGVGVGSVFTAAGLFVIAAANGNAVAAGAVALFSRLSRPKVLDQPTRSRIVELVTLRPGLRFNEVATTLELANGTAMHHLRLLVRENVLCRVKHSYFVRGAQDHADMVAQAALAQPRAREIYEVLLRQSRQSLPEVARLLGISRSWVGKVAKDLERAGLLQRERVGRSDMLQPASASPKRSA